MLIQKAFRSVFLYISVFSMDGSAKNTLKLRKTPKNKYWCFVQMLCDGGEAYEHKSTKFYWLYFTFKGFKRVFKLLEDVIEEFFC